MLIRMIFLVFSFPKRMLILRLLILQEMMLFLLVPPIFFQVLVKQYKTQGFYLILLRLILFNFRLFFGCLLILMCLFVLIKNCLKFETYFFVDFFAVLGYFPKFHHTLGCPKYHSPCSSKFQNSLPHIPQIMKFSSQLFFCLHPLQTLNREDFPQNFHQS